MSLPKQQPSSGRLFWIIGLAVGLVSGAVVALTIAGLVTPASADGGETTSRVAGVAVHNAL